MSGPGPRSAAIRSRPLATLAAVAVLGVGGATLAGCEAPGGGDDETVATPTTDQVSGATGPSGSDGKKEEGQDSESGGTQAPQDTYDPEQDVEGNDIPPPPGSPQEKFEKECEQNPELCD